MKLAHALPRTCGGVPAECASPPRAAVLWGYAAEAIGGLEYSPCRGCVANTAHNNHTGSRPTGSFCLMTAQTIPARRLPLLWIETENNCPAASGHRGQRWGKVEGRRFSAPPFSVSPQDNGKLKNISTHHFI